MHSAFAIMRYINLLLTLTLTLLGPIKRRRHSLAAGTRQCSCNVRWCTVLLPQPLITPAPDRGAEYCDKHVCACVCVRVCLSARGHFFGTTRQIFTEFFVNGCGSVLFCQRSDTLCTSGFMDDVILAHKPRLLDVAAQLKCSAHAALDLAINCAQ